MKLRIPRPLSAGFILSYRCTARCRHCIYGCSQQWPGDWPDETQIEQLLSFVKDKIVPATGGPRTVGLNEGLHFTGGEPFIKFELLLKAVEIASQMGIPSLFVETNCYWATDDKKTLDRLKALKDKGLHGIMISVNPFYLEFVPFERTERVIRYSLEIFGYNTMIYQLEYYRRFKKYGIKGTMTLQEYIQMEGPDMFLRDVEFFPMGRAPYALEEILTRYYFLKTAVEALQEGCIVAPARALHNHFDNYGNYIPGFCGGIAICDMTELENVIRDGIDTTDKPVLRFVLQQNIQGLYRFAKQHGYTERKEGYVSICHLCMDIRAYLVSTGDYPELRPKAFYKFIKQY